MAGHARIARQLLDSGADPTIRDTEHDSTALGWAQFFKRPEIVEMLKPRV